MEMVTWTPSLAGKSAESMPVGVNLLSYMVNGGFTHRVTGTYVFPPVSSLMWREVVPLLQDRTQGVAHMGNLATIMGEVTRLNVGRFGSSVGMLDRADWYTLYLVHVFYGGVDSVSALTQTLDLLHGFVTGVRRSVVS